MKRHADALILLGWYLMIPLPPEKPESPSWGDYFAGLFRRTNSFSEWKIAQSFDSASDCEKGRTELFSGDFMKNLSATMSELKPEQKVKQQAIMQALPRALCIATDDPRLAR